MSSLSLPEHSDGAWRREGPLPIMFTGKPRVGMEIQPHQTPEAPCPPHPREQLAEMTAESKNGFGKHDVKRNVQLLHTECTA